MALTGLDLQDKDISGCDLSGANLIGKNFAGANLTATNFEVGIHQGHAGARRNEIRAR